MKRSPIARRTPLRSNPDKTRQWKQNSAAPLKRSGSIKKLSARRAAEKVIYHQVAAAHMEANPCCARCLFFGIESAAHDCHHLAGTTGHLYTDPDNLMSVCRPCHDWIHANGAQAKAEGWQRTRHGKGGRE